MVSIATRAWEYLSTLLYAVCKRNLVSFPHQLAQISGYTFEFIQNIQIMRHGVIPTQSGGPIMTGTRESFSMLHYAMYKGNLVSFPHQVALGIQISGYTFESAIIK